MVDKKTGVKPKAKAPKAQKSETSNKKVVKKEPKLKEETPEKNETEKLIPNSELLVTPEPKATAKAGRHSAKAIAEAEAERVRQERIKTDKEALEEKPKVTTKPPRSRLERAGKKYRNVAKLIDKGKSYSLAEALDLAVKTSPVKFDATVELHVNLGVDPTQADQNVRDSVTLPAGTGKTLRVAVFAEGEQIAQAKAAGADIAGESDLLAQLDKEQIDFDIFITSPNLMTRLGKYAKVLGPKGLMPNPKSGSLTTDVTKAVKEAKSGRIEYRVDAAGIIHLGIGKVSFGASKLLQNAETIITSIRAAKPASTKGIYINSVFISSSMGPSIRVGL